ncbi:MAG: hypothetical protein OH316_00965 [Candidatus Parvarchaeota archaeon]|nr:hypothetical protein [Candidatus Parvarchaeota archaeon]
MGGNKVEEAIHSISRCIGRFGFYASSDRYKYEYWTRDLFYSLEPLIRLGLGDKVKQHLSIIWKDQRKDGMLPRYFLDHRYKWVPRKFYLELRGRKFLRTIKARNTIETRYRHWTVDSSMLAVLATYKFSRMTGDEEFLRKLRKNISLAVKSIESLRVDGFVRGGDWRDSLPELEFKFLLSNNVMLYSVYKAVGKDSEADELKRAINRRFWNGVHYADFIGSKNTDPLGLSFAVLSGLIPRSRYRLVSKQLLSSSSRHGILSNVDSDSIWDMRTVNLTSCNHIYSVWPFVSYYAVLALNKMGKVKEARSEAEKLESLPGFYEWYDPDTGRHHGSRDQLWNAAMYVEEKIQSRLR